MKRVWNEKFITLQLFKCYKSSPKPKCNPCTSETQSHRQPWSKLMDLNLEGLWTLGRTWSRQGILILACHLNYFIWTKVGLFPELGSIHTFTPFTNPILGWFNVNKGVSTNDVDEPKLSSLLHAAIDICQVEYVHFNPVPVGALTASLHWLSPFCFLAVVTAHQIEN